MEEYDNTYYKVLIDENGAAVKTARTLAKDHKKYRVRVVCQSLALMVKMGLVHMGKWPEFV